MSNVTSNSAVASAHVCRPWFTNRSNAFVALLFAVLGIAAAVGLGSGDWYIVEASSYGGSATTPSGPTFTTAVFGLRLGYVCNGPQAPIAYGTNSASEGFGTQSCTPYTYRSKYLYFQWVHDENNAATSTQKDAASDAVTAYQHLIGASGIILALLAIAVVIAAHQFFVHVFTAHGVWAPSLISGRIALVILIILEALVLIFWITIFPYKYFYDQEATAFGTGVASYDTYHTLGLGFSIQIAGLLVGLFGLFMYPKDVVTLKQNSV